MHKTIAVMVPMVLFVCITLRLFYLDELSIQELCEITSWTTVNAKVILHRARKRIQVVLQKLLKIEYHESPR